MKLLEITKEEFDKLPLIRKLLCNEEHPHKFALLFVADSLEPVTLCWHSELVKPQIINNDSTPLLWFGIDQQVIAINKKSGKLTVMVKLETNLLEMIVTENSVILRTELEILSFNLSGINQSLHYLPEISESINIKNSTATVSLIDGDKISLTI